MAVAVSWGEWDWSLGVCVRTNAQGGTPGNHFQVAPGFRGKCVCHSAGVDAVWVTPVFSTQLPPSQDHRAVC